MLTVGEQLLKLGHDAEIYSNILGEMAELARSRGIKVCGVVEELSAAADIIISQDGIVAYTLSAHWPKVPQVFVCHSPLFELQTPPAIPGVVSLVVVMSDRFGRRVEALDTKHRIVRLRQPIDVERLVSYRTPRKRPETALLLGNYLDGEARRILVDAWSSAGISVQQVGNKAIPSLTPGDAINDADIVVGKGRAVLDAMACGRPAYVYDAFGTDGWVTPKNYEALEGDAFSGLALPRVTDASHILRDLDDYDPQMGIANRELIMMHHHARIHVQQLIEISRDLASPDVPETTPKRELARLVNAVWVAESQLFGLRNALAPIEDRATRTAEDNAHLHDELATARSEIDRLTRGLADAHALLEDARSKIAATRPPIDLAQSRLQNLSSNFRARVERLGRRLASRFYNQKGRI